MTKKVLFVDGFNLYMRAISITAKKKYNLKKAVFLFLNMLQKIVTKIKPDRIVIVWDGDNSRAIRRTYNQDYKTNRGDRLIKDVLGNSNNKNLIKQKTLIFIYLLNILNNTSIIQFKFEDYEADDVIAFLTRNSFLGYEKYIFSNDKDYLQLLDEFTFILTTPNSKKYVTLDSFIKENHISPENFALQKAINGDVSDNIFGIEKLGNKTFVKIFPFVTDRITYSPKKYFDFAEQAQNIKNKSKYSRILLQKEKIKTNFYIIQLYKTLLKKEQIDLIKETFLDYDYSYSLANLNKALSKVNLTHFNFKDLVVDLRHIENQGKTEEVLFLTNKQIEEKNKIKKMKNKDTKNTTEDIAKEDKLKQIKLNKIRFLNSKMKK